MPVAYLPSPGRDGWRLGPLLVHGDALFIILGILVGVWVAQRRYGRIGGGPGLILDVAAWTIPFGLVPAGLHVALTEAHRHLGWLPGLWSGAATGVSVVGVPGAVALGAVGAWIACRRYGVRLGAVAGVAAPAAAFGQAVAWLGAWFGQQMYGPPSTLPWAVQIAPQHRVAGYEDYATFHPLFLYAALWELIVGGVVIWTSRRFALVGERAFAVQLGLSSGAALGVRWLWIGQQPRLLGAPDGAVVAIAVIAGTAAYLYRTRHRRGPGYVVSRPPVSVGPSPRGTVAPGVGPDVGHDAGRDGREYPLGPVGP